MNLIPMEFKNQRIITTKALAEAYGTDEHNINKNFNANKERFTEGKHYFQLKGSELKEFKRFITNSDDPSLKFASVLTLWTDRGAARHAKILETDKAWEVYEVLEDTYFSVQALKADSCTLEDKRERVQRWLEEQGEFEGILQIKDNMIEELEQDRDNFQDEYYGLQEVVGLSTVQISQLKHKFYDRLDDFIGSPASHLRNVIDYPNSVKMEAQVLLEFKAKVLEAIPYKKFDEVMEFADKMKI